MITTAHDLARLIDAILGGRLLPDPLVSAMTSPQGPNRSDLEQYGYGCELAVVTGRSRSSVTAAGMPASRRCSLATSPRDHALGRVQPGPRLGPPRSACRGFGLSEPRG
jgi:hypothetical protein